MVNDVYFLIKQLLELENFFEFVEDESFKSLSFINLITQTQFNT